jgi:hypothetical protein
MNDLQTAMEKLTQLPGICPEARVLIEMALKAQAEGGMPDLGALKSEADTGKKMGGERWGD